MFIDHLQSAWRALKRSPALTALMVAALALGVGASMTTLTIYRVLSQDPLPGKSDRVITAQLDAAAKGGSAPPGAEPPNLLTRWDAEALVNAKKARYQALMAGGQVVIVPDSGERFIARPRYTSSDFFPMFKVPMAQGRPWGAEQDEGREPVVVLSHEMNQRLFGGAASLDKSITVGRHRMRVIGVMAPWRMVPSFYDVDSGAYSNAPDLLMPFSTAMDLKLGTAGSRQCWAESSFEAQDPRQPCAWVQFWAELDSAAGIPAYQQFLEAYSETQRASGRFERPTNVRVRTVPQWLQYRDVLPDDVKLQLWLAMGFLAVCVLNTVGLMLAKTMRRAGEIGVRRALGASRATMAAQFLTEASVVGLLGAVGGLALAQMGLLMARGGTGDQGQLARMDPTMLAITVGVAVLAAVLAGVLPAWRASQISPALQLKIQ